MSVQREHEKLNKSSCGAHFDHWRKVDLSIKQCVLGADSLSFLIALKIFGRNDFSTLVVTAAIPSG